MIKKLELSLFVMLNGVKHLFYEDIRPFATAFCHAERSEASQAGAEMFSVPWFYMN